MLQFIQQRLASFKWAFKGIGDLFSHHPNAKVHLFATGLVVPLSFWLQITAIEWCLIVLCIVLVMSMEAMNSALEYLADKVSLEENELIGKAKDIAAAAVLISSIGAILVGGLILLPKFYLLFNL
jgi:diacylglycerol kinase